MSDTQYEAESQYDQTASEVSWFTWMFVTTVVIGLLLLYVAVEGQHQELAEYSRVFTQMMLLVWLAQTAKHFLLYNNLFREPAEKAWNRVMSR